MRPSAELVVVLLAGYVVALPGLLWGLADLRRIPGGVWRHAAQRPYVQWRTGMIGAYLISGWPVYVTILVWRRSRERADLYEEWAELSRRKAARKAAKKAAKAGRREAPPVIVLADYEDAPSPERGHADA
jgi:hypothetical protein